MKPRTTTMKKHMRVLRIHVSQHLWWVAPKAHVPLDTVRGAVQHAHELTMEALTRS